jgi:hypothetical protein
MTAPLTDVLARVEWPEPVLDAETVTRWPAGDLDRLVRLGVVAEIGPAPAAACDACGFDHVEVVRWVYTPGRPPRALVTCPECGLVPVDPARLRQWAVRPSTLADAVARTVRTSAAAEPRVPGRVWRLGVIRAGGRAVVGFLAVGLGRNDAAAVVAGVPELRAANALVVVPTVAPPHAVWGDTAPTVVSLADLLSLDASGLVVDHALLESVLTPGSVARTRTSAAFPTPPGTTWEQVEVLVEERRVVVRVGDVSRSYGFTEAGFEDRRKRDMPDKAWLVLTTFARFSGVLGTGDTLATKPGDLKKSVSNLRTRLCDLLGISTDPFAPVRKGQSYRTRFTIRSVGGATFPTPAGARWDDVTVTEVSPGRVEVSVTADVVGATRTAADERGKRWEPSTSTGERVMRYELAQLGWDAPAREALVVVLRACGRVARPATDLGMLALGQALAAFLQLADPPFTFDPSRTRWVAQFEAASLVPPSDR